MIFNGRYGRWDVNLRFQEYSQGGTCIRLVTTTGSPVATATVHLPTIDLAKDEVAIKDYSENEGVLDFLVENGIVSSPVRWVQSGYVKIHICKLLKKS